MNRKILSVFAAVAAGVSLVRAEAAERSLPQGYEPVEFVRATGTQYIDTRYVHAAGTRVICDVLVERDQGSEYCGIFGSIPNDRFTSDGSFAFFAPFGSFKTSKEASVAYSRTGFEATRTGFPFGKRVELSCTGNRAVWKSAAGGGEIVNDRCRADAGKSTMLIFNFNNATSAGVCGVRADRFCRMRLYAFRIEEGAALKRDFVPCRRTADGAVGLFDRVGGKFHGNDGTGRLLAPGEEGNALAVRPNAKPFAYNPMIFGSFLEHFHRQIYGGIFEPGSKLADADGFRSDVIAALKEIKTPIVRWPGGCFVSAYHWKDGVGKVRESTFDKAWAVEEPNTFGTDEYVKWCRKVGCAPYICTNAGTGTPEEMSDWVEYCNATVGRYARLRAANGNPEPFNVKYWSVGNENWGGHETGAKTSAEWGPFVRESAKMMLEVDKELKLFAAATTSEAWTAPLLNAAGRYLDYVSIHSYGDPLFLHYRPSPYLKLVSGADYADHAIAATRRIIDRAGLSGRVKIAYDEWNPRSWHHPGHGRFRRGFDIPARAKNDTNATYTMADAVYTACFLNSFLRNGDVMAIACFSPAVNTTGLVYVHPNGIVKRTTFHVFWLYANRLLPKAVASDTVCDRLACGRRSVKVLDAAVTTDGSGHWAIAVVNKDPANARSFGLDFASMGIAAPKNVEAEILAGDSPDAYNDVGAENRVIPQKRLLPVSRSGAVSLPPHSVTVLTF